MSKSSGSWLKLGVCTAAVLAIATAVYRLAFGNVDGFVRTIDHCEQLFCDFRNVYYPSAKTLLLVGLPLRTYYYPLTLAALLSVLPRHVADPQVRVLWGILQVAASAALVGVPFLAFLKRSVGQWGFALGAFLLSAPVLHNFKWGQVSVLVNLGVLVAFAAGTAGMPFLGGASLAVAITLKPHSAIALFYFIVRKDFRFVGACAVSVVVLGLLVPIALLGPSATFQSYPVIARQVEEAVRTWVPTDDNSQFLVHVVTRTVSPAAAAFLRAPMMWLGLGLLFVNLVLVVRLARRSLRDEMPLALMLLFLSQPLFVPTSWPHHLSYLPLVQAMLLERVTNGSGPVRATKLFVLLLSVLLSSLALPVLLGWQVYARAGSLFLSNALLLVLLYLELLAKGTPHSAVET